MSRIRSIKPQLFRHYGLYQAEIKSGLPLRLAFIALFCCVDREGRFKWRPEELKPDMFPFDDVDVAAILDALHAYGFVDRYEAGGKEYGVIPTFHLHQHISVREQPSVLPDPLHGTKRVQVPDKAGTKRVQVPEKAGTSTGVVPDSKSVAQQQEKKSDAVPASESASNAAQDGYKAGTSTVQGGYLYRMERERELNLKTKPSDVSKSYRNLIPRVALDMPESSPGNEKELNPAKALTPVDVAKRLIEWERERGKKPHGLTASQQPVIDLAALDVDEAELRRAYDAAVAERLIENDPQAINAGFVRALVEAGRRPKALREDNGWKRTDAGIDRKAKELGIVCPPGRDYAYLLDRCEAAIRERANGGRHG